MKDKLLTTREAAELLGVRPNTLAVWRITKKVDIPYVKIGRSVRYKQSDLESFMDKNKSKL